MYCNQQAAAFALRELCFKPLAERLEMDGYRIGDEHNCESTFDGVATQQRDSNIVNTSPSTNTMVFYAFPIMSWEGGVVPASWMPRTRDGNSKHAIIASAAVRSPRYRTRNTPMQCTKGSFTSLRSHCIALLAKGIQNAESPSYGPFSLDSCFNFVIHQYHHIHQYIRIPICWISPRPISRTSSALLV